MASSSSPFDAYRIPAKFLVDTGTVVHTEQDLDVIPTNKQRAGWVEMGWEEHNPLGSGAFGSVRLEKNELTGKLRAVKLITKDVLLECGIDYKHELGIFIAVKDVSVDPPIAYNSS